MRYDAIIIGAGMSGLAAAIRLAQAGRRVVLLERHELWGGLNSFYTRDGHAFDVGLHALTNFAPPRTHGAPLTRVLRQLRLRHAELRLGEQRHSELRMPGLTLRFSNDPELLRSEVARAFPSSLEGFDRLVRIVRETELDEAARVEASGRALLEEHLRDPPLVQALLLPLFYYGSAREDDVDRSQLAVLFRSIFLEGLSRPEGGIRPFLNLLIKRLKRSGAELRLRCGVRRVLLEGGAARGVELDDGSVLESEHVLSSAGYVESMRLCGAEFERERVRPADRGRLSFVESISVVDRDPRSLGLEAATVFYSTCEEVHYRRPEALVDVRSGVLSVPTNFHAERPPREPLVRLTVLADHDRWQALAPETYAEEKQRQAERAIAAATALLPDWRAATTYRDVFTPCTVRRFTGHDGGCVYGSPRKRPDGDSGVPGLHLIGTDQGYLGVVGAMVSGIAMANRHVLSPSHAAQAPPLAYHE